MRTRRSPRNQDRLWKALGGYVPPPKARRGPLPTKAQLAAARAAEWAKRAAKATEGE